MYNYHYSVSCEYKQIFLTQDTLIMYVYLLSGARSVHRDLETQLALVTINETLRQKLLEEQQQLYNRGTPFTSEVASQPDRKPPFWVKTVLSFFKNFFKIYD